MVYNGFFVNGNDGDLNSILERLTIVPWTTTPRENYQPNHLRMGFSRKNPYPPVEDFPLSSKVLILDYLCQRHPEGLA